MSTTLAAAFAAALALNATAVEPVTVVSAPAYDPCAAAPLVKVAQNHRLHHRTRRGVAHHRPAPVVRPHRVLLHKAKIQHRIHHHAVRLMQAHETCGAGGGVVGAFDLSGLTGAPAIGALQADTPTGVDATALVGTPAEQQPIDQPVFAPVSDDNGPFILGPGGFGGGGGGGSGGGGGGGGGSGGGGGTTPIGPPTGPGVPPVGPGSPPVTPGGPPTTPITPPAGPPISPISAVPEPSTWAFLLTGFAMLGGALRRWPARA
jgi:uncharacterized membrane protein YgcG